MADITVINVNFHDMEISVFCSNILKNIVELPDKGQEILSTCDLLVLVFKHFYPDESWFSDQRNGTSTFASEVFTSGVKNSLNFFAEPFEGTLQKHF